MWHGAQNTGRRLGAVATFVIAAWPAAVAAQGSAKPVRAVGEVTADDVYVRSGPSLNHYTICKLNVGARVDIVGEIGKWFEIRPPTEVFSLISGDYVDTADDKSGVVNGNNVRVRAGSTLNDNMYTVQTKLSRGARVTILGRNPDGFLRIAPPAEVTLWISAALVEKLPASRLASQAQRAATPAPTITPAGTTAENTTAPKKKRKPSVNAATVARKDGAKITAARKADRSAPAPATVSAPVKTRMADAKLNFLAGLPSTAQRKTLERLDVMARTELKKPPIQRDFESLIRRYRPIAEQTEDDFAGRYARARIGRLENMSALIATLKKLRTADDEASSARRRFLEGRAKIGEAMPAIPSGIDVEGELRRSAVYPAGSGQERFRLVDTSGGKERTIGYVEIPPETGIEVESLIGQYVGVRASAKRLQTGGVDPVTIFVAGELVRLEKTASSPGK